MFSIEVVPSFTPVPSCKPLLEWFMTEYLSDHSVDLTVVYMPLSDEGVMGWFLIEDDHEFVIQIDENLRGDEHDRTLLHELTHMKQYLLGLPRCELCTYFQEDELLDRYKDVE